MPILEDLQINFDRSDETYKAGETVAGTISFTLSKPKNINEVRWRASGEAKTHWTESEYKTRQVESRRRRHGETNRNRQRRTSTEIYEEICHYSEEWSYFDVSDRLMGDDNVQTTLEAGEHSYDFSFELPEDIPCSFDHKYGCIIYTVKAIVERPVGSDLEVESSFTVVTPYDSDIKEGFSEGINDEIEQGFSSWYCLDGGVMNIKVSSFTSGFTPGKMIKLKISYDDSSTRVDIKAIKLKLIQIFSFHGEYNGRKEKKQDWNILKSVKDQAPFNEEGYCLIKMKVPALPPSNLQYCKIIDVDYQLDLSIKFSGWRSKIRRSYEIQLWDDVPTLCEIESEENE